MKRRKIASMIEEDVSSVALMTACMHEFNIHDLSCADPAEEVELKLAFRRFANLLATFYRSQKTLAKNVM